MTSFTTTWTHSCAPLPFTAVAHFADTCSRTCANAPRRVHLEQELEDGHGRVDDDAGEKEPLTTASKTSKKRKHKSIKLDKAISIDASVYKMWLLDEEAQVRLRRFVRLLCLWGRTHSA